MRVRQANIGDTERVLELLEEAHPHSPFASFTDFSRPMWRERWFHHLAAQSSLCLVCESSDVVQGIFIGQATDHPAAPLRIGIEIVKWIDPGHRGPAWPGMRSWFEAWAIGNGCTLTSLSTDGDQRFIRAHSRSGYSPVETHLVKRLLAT